MAAIDIEALRAELLNDPAGLGYAGKTADECLALLKTTQEVERFVPLKDLQSMLMETVATGAQVPAWWVLKATAKGGAGIPAQLAALAEMAFDLFSSRLENLNTRGAFQAQALLQLQGAGLIDQAIADKIAALALKDVARGEHLFGRMPTALEVALAQMGG